MTRDSALLVTRDSALRPSGLEPLASSLTLPLDSIPDHGTLSLTLPSGERVCLIRRGMEVSALRDECPHQGMPLSAGEVLPDGTIECSWHGARFDCVTGAVRGGPAEDDVKAFAVRVDGGQVLVESRDAG